jgi:hypothetical protein
MILVTISAIYACLSMSVKVILYFCQYAYIYTLHFSYGENHVDFTSLILRIVIL